MDTFVKTVEASTKTIERHANRLGEHAERFGQRVQKHVNDMEASLRTPSAAPVPAPFKLQDIVQWVKDTFGVNTDMVYDCAKKNDVQMLLQILDGATPEMRPKLLEYKDSRGRTPLIMASSHGHVLCVEVLLQHGAFIDAMDNKGNTPLHYACQEGAMGVVQFLMSIPGVSPYIQNNRGLSPLEVARRSVENKVLNAAGCVNLLENRTQVFQGWVYESVDNMGSSLLGLSALQSWAHRYVIILRVGSPQFLEMAFFDVVQGQRSPLPKSTFMLHVPSPVTLHTKAKMFDSKPFAFKVFGARKKGAGLVGALHEREFAAPDQESFNSWAAFLTGGGAVTALVDPYLMGHPGVEFVSTPQEPGPTTPIAPPIPPLQSMPPIPQVPSEAAQQPPLLPRAKALDDNFVYAPSVSVAAVQAAAASAPPLEEHVASTHLETTVPGECVVCFDGPQNAVCVPCGHAAVCMRCADHMKQTSQQCPVCRADVRQVVQLFHV
ncbi:hypothetical protein H310_07376 [Aphanomyces invadans]|uniref:RING-type domain-containing protein n=1 Tax=Aphanomyces invadans TaxID=157072 RepID=A0A024U3Q5_9STRA|nr:hypothetical protein H310_07376 [Aphanomyces invadans]ETW00850.1 hypothetical protein H310_07376 [Aphanomyces invadans]|eukprot:XP_008870985.1 hypothetical protein H310_07376 [Aphanomyces invadans]